MCIAGYMNKNNLTIAYLFTRTISMNKNLIISAILAIAVVSCGGLPRRTILDVSDKPQTYALDACGLQVTIPPGWAVQAPSDPTRIGELYVVKDKVEILLDIMVTEPQAEKIWPKLEVKAEKERNEKHLQLNRTEKKKINGIEAVTFYGTAGANSIDVDAFNCPSGTSSVAFYVFSPNASYKSDRAAVLQLVNSVKLADGVTPSKSVTPTKKK
jgi:hypothetical protein